MLPATGGAGLGASRPALASPRFGLHDGLARGRWRLALSRWRACRQLVAPLALSGRPEPALRGCAGASRLANVLFAPVCRQLVGCPRVALPCGMRTRSGASRGAPAGWQPAALKILASLPGNAGACSSLPALA